MEKSFVTFKDVSFRYQEEQPWIFNGLNISVNRNEWVAIIGHNGSGKSTIAKLMNGLLFPQEGTISVDQMELQDETIWDIRKKIGMVFQNPDNQFVGTTVMDDVAFGLENHGIPREEMKRRIKASLNAVGMIDYIHHEPHRLSGGQKQRIAIASVLAIAPEMIILDEATAMLDPIGRKEIMKTVHQLREQRDVSIVTITHDLNEVTYADRVIVMNKGEVWYEGTPREVFAKQRQLDEIGLGVPLVTQFAHELKRYGMELEPEPINQKELVDALWKYHSTM
ncbi:energy-coupling factor ABC transporter ATP-binding protein [Pontibacillus litoralis]|uniref:Cobalt ABC transporter ATP-binding protein n=1 Tax=Pontibacillus litoralis JSM 072002 TaxID=1385512 RepID=A0A0A5G2H9_9BACI|nr:energy-coupling factor ABC transporter ATP-binding protein [Pontibacillus litoralis]KGX85353.1 cobalt ABC transporter ATP-binding protein [Pontibacillus litoralis JSM 072002]